MLMTGMAWLHKARSALLILAFSAGQLLLFVSVFAGFTSGRFYAAAAALYSGFLLIVISIIWGHGKAVRQRIVALIGIFTGIILIFGAIHYSLFLYRPTMYAFSSSLEEGKTLEAFSRDYARVLDLSKRLYALAIADAQITKVAEASKNVVVFVNPGKVNPEIVTEKGFVPLSKGCRIRFRHDIWSVPEISEIDLMELRCNDNTFLFGGHFIPWHPQERRVSQLFGAKSEDEVRAAFESLIGEIQAERDAAFHTLEVQISSRPEWELVDFLYFSTITLTTVGFGDIIPNSTGARVVVLLNAITGVFFIAFALVFLWPNERNGRGNSEEPES